MERIEKLKQYLLKNPKDAFLRHALALEEIKLGNLTVAISLFKELLEEQPRYIGSYYHLAKLFEKTRDLDNASFWYQKGMAMAKEMKDNHAYNELMMAFDEME